MRIGVHRWTWGDDFPLLNLETFLYQAKHIGAEAVEMKIPEAAMQRDTYECRKIRQMLKELDMELYCSAGTPAAMDMCSEDPTVRDAAVEYLKQAIAAAETIGVRKLSGVIHSVWPAKYDDDYISSKVREERRKRSLDSMSRVLPFAEEHGILINLELVNRFEHYLLNTVDEGVAFCKELGSPNCKLLLDVFHMSVEEDDLVQAIHKAKGYIGHFHVSEPNRKVPFQSKNVPWKDIGRALAQVGYDDSVIIEAVLKFCGADSYQMRIWRDLQEDVSLDGRMQALKDGIIFIKKEFEVN